MFDDMDKDSEYDAVNPDWEQDMPYCQYQQGSDSPTNRELIEFIDSIPLDDPLMDATVFEDEDQLMMPQPHADHNYSVPDICSEITIIGEYLGQSPLQDNVIGSTNDDEIVLKDITEVIEKDFSRSSSPASSDKVSFAGCGYNFAY